MDKHNWTEAEKYYFILHEYLEVEKRIEIWFQLCQLSISIPEIKKELEILNCWKEGINFHEIKYDSREVKIIRRWKLSAKFQRNLCENILSIQNRIDKKITLYLNQNPNTAPKDKLFRNIKWRTV